MNIGIDGSRAFMAQKTGTENYSFQLLSHLCQVDQINNYYIYLRPQNVVNEAKWPKNWHFIKIAHAKFWTQVGLAKQTFIDSHLDILFIPSHTLPVFFRSNLKTVVTVHDLGAEYLSTMHQLKQRIYLKFMTYRQLKRAIHLIAVSHATKEDLINKVGIPEEKISIIYEGYDKELFKPLSKESCKSTLSKHNLVDQNYFLFVGTIQPRKNLKRLILSFEKYLKTPTVASSINTNRQPLLVLAGGKGWLSEEIYDLPRQLGIENRVRFLGYVPDQDLPALYSQAIAFLFPTLFEGFGLPILEAMASECPVLTSNTSSLPEVAGDAAVLVDPYSIESITKGIIEISNQPVRQKLIQKGLKQINKFSWEKTARETLQVLENL